MKALLLFVGFVIVNCLWGGLSHAYAKSTASLDKMQLVNDKLWMYYEEGSQLTAEDILTKYQQNTLINNTNGRVSYGLTGNTVWGAVELDSYSVLVTRIAKNSPIKVAEEIKGQVRGSDITFHWGGEEFLVFLPNTRGHYAKQIAENLRVHLFTHDINKFIRVTVSIGVAGTSPGEEEITKRRNKGSI
ncbi:diguanylate cyclase [Alteromonas macleodii]|uniref:diguanylate cyclase n=1 Tax=Alteromonas macleodii TaxID=28108 RepID=UPI0022AFCCCB|nr:diguanylate cyclase [Alteromonas macleodii]MCZ4240787.1 diguanylate cyclase [Alteromonas macleodii]